MVALSRFELLTSCLSRTPRNTFIVLVISYFKELSS